MTIDDATGFGIPDQTGERKGTPGYEAHVRAEQEAMRAHTERMAGRPLTAGEAQQLDDVVAEAIARYARN